MIRFFRGLWYARQRRIDLEILWPTCKANARDLEIAKVVFCIHVAQDPAWLDVDADHVVALLEALE